MDDTGILRGLIISRPPTLGQVQRQNRYSRLLVILLVALVCLLPTIFGIQALWQGWQNGRWDDSFWNPFLTQVFVPLLLASVSLFSLTAYWWQKTNEKVKGVASRPLRAAAAAGDQRLAPLAEKHPLLLDSANGATPSSQDAHFKPLAAGEEGKYLNACVDEQGVEWTGPSWWRPGKRRIAWNEARAFYTFSYLHRGRSQSESQQVYVLDAPATTLAWVVPLPGRASSTQERAASERLQTLIATGSGLPLRDVTTAAEEVEKLATNTEVSLFIREPAAGTTPLSSPPSLAPQRITRPKRSLFPFVGLAPLLLLVLLASTAFGVRTYESSMFNALLVQIHTHQPLFHDALSTPDDFWTVHLSPPPLNTAPPTYGYVGGAYQLRGIATPTLTAPGTYGDVAVEVTVRLLGQQAPDEQYDSFGLLLHTDGFELSGVSFDISPDGIWSIGPLSTVFAASSAIHTAPGAPNRLTVILRGQQDILYINNQFVGLYEASGPTTGLLGFEAETDTARAAFTDFTIYPL